MGEKGKERDRDPAENSNYLACSRRDKAKPTKPPERKRETSLNGEETSVK